jgi:hypothetical protein
MITALCESGALAGDTTKLPSRWAKLLARMLALVSVCTTVPATSHRASTPAPSATTLPCQPSRLLETPRGLLGKCWSQAHVVGCAQYGRKKRAPTSPITSPRCRPSEKLSTMVV